MDREAVEPDSQQPQWIKIAITAIEKGSSRGSIDSLAVESYRDCLKIVFQKEKNTDMNAIKYAIQLKIRGTF